MYKFGFNKSFDAIKSKRNVKLSKDLTHKHQNSEYNPGLRQRADSLSRSFFFMRFRRLSIEATSDLRER